MLRRVSKHIYQSHISPEQSGVLFYKGLHMAETEEQWAHPALEVLNDNKTALAVWEGQRRLLPGGDRFAAFRETVPETPLALVSAEALPADVRATGFTVWIKDDRLMPGGSYKLRGAWNKLRDEAEARGDVAHLTAVAASTGNHANQVARAARALGYKGTVAYCPEDTSLVKLYDGVSNGVEIVTLPDLGAALKAAEAHGNREEAVFVPPFDDIAIMAGQGTVTVEASEQLASHGLVPEDTPMAFFFAGGGGGLAAGNAVAVARLLPGATVTVAQAEGANGMTFALDGVPFDMAMFRNKCDGAAVPTPGALPMEILSDERLAAVATVSDAQIGEAMAVLSRSGLVPEPAGALGMAQLLAHIRADPEGHGVLVAHVSGANKTPQKVAEYMGDALAAGLIPAHEASRVCAQAYQERTVDGVDEILLRTGQRAGALGMRVISSPAR